MKAAMVTMNRNAPNCLFVCIPCPAPAMNVVTVLALQLLFNRISFFRWTSCSDFMTCFSHFHVTGVLSSYFLTHFEATDPVLPSLKFRSLSSSRHVMCLVSSGSIVALYVMMNHREMSLSTCIYTPGEKMVLEWSGTDSVLTVRHTVLLIRG